MDNLERPDGSVVTPIGWGLILLGVVGIFIAASAETLNGALLGFGLANLGLGLGVLLLSLGYLVKAIWFLPGREIPIEDHRPATSSQLEICGWCGRAPGSGRPCSALPTASVENLARAGKFKDPVCQENLRQRGYDVAQPYDHGGV